MGQAKPPGTVAEATSRGRSPAAGGAGTASSVMHKHRATAHSRSGGKLAAPRTLLLQWRSRAPKKFLLPPTQRCCYQASNALMPASSARFLGGARLSAHARSAQLTTTCAPTTACSRKLRKKPVCCCLLQPLFACAGTPTQCFPVQQVAAAAPHAPQLCQGKLWASLRGKPSEESSTTALPHSTQP